MTDHRGLVAPVTWRSRLRRGDGIGYTEVGGVPVLIDAVRGEVQMLTPLWASIWSRLDGGPVDESLGVQPEEMDPIDRRNVIEVLRRLKSHGLLRDVDPGEVSGSPEPFEPAPDDFVASFSLSGFVRRSAGIRTLVVDRHLTDRVTLRARLRGGTLSLAEMRRLSKPNIELVEIDTRGVNSGLTEPMQRLAALVGALAERDFITLPGGTDLLADLAEHATTHAATGESRRGLARPET